jgi:uncharacterized glyoxalase superfamily protein PhnB
MHRPAYSSKYKLFALVKNIEALYEELKNKGVLHPKGTLENRPWGLKQFAVLDGDGNLIEFGELMNT